MSAEYDQALHLVRSTLTKIRGEVPSRGFDPTKVAEIEVNEFAWKGKSVPRVMVVLRATGCEHYTSNAGCAMCAHFDGTTANPVTTANYLAQWESVLNGTAIDNQPGMAEFDINNYPILCLYNLGSLLNPKEVPPEAVNEIFYSLNGCPGVEKVIIESRAEYITREALENIRNVYGGTVEVGIGLESINHDVRELGHNKNMPDLKVFENAVALLHEFGFKALAYVNQKPAFLTEQEAIDDAVETSVYAFKTGVDAVSIEPTSIQNHSLIDKLNKDGLYRVPWLWSVREAVRGIYAKLGSDQPLDLRLGGYFDAEVISGSQGYASGVERNELFPHTTSGNCDHCDKRMVAAIKEFNRVNDPNVLYNEPQCPHCYPEWQKDIVVVDPRPLPQRIIDVLGSKT